MSASARFDEALAELHQRRSAIDAEIAELYSRRAKGEKKPRQRRTTKPAAVAPSQEAIERVRRDLRLGRNLQ